MANVTGYTECGATERRYWVRRLGDRGRQLPGVIASGFIEDAIAAREISKIDCFSGIIFMAHTLRHMYILICHIVEINLSVIIVSFKISQ